MPRTSPADFRFREQQNAAATTCDAHAQHATRARDPHRLRTVPPTARHEPANSCTASYAEVRKRGAPWAPHEGERVLTRSVHPPVHLPDPSTRHDDTGLRGFEASVLNERWHGATPPPRGGGRSMPPCGNGKLPPVGPLRRYREPSKRQTGDVLRTRRVRHSCVRSTPAAHHDTNSSTRPRQLVCVPPTVGDPFREAGYLMRGHGLASEGDACWVAVSSTHATRARGQARALGGRVRFSRGRLLAGRIRGYFPSPRDTP